MLHPSRRRTPRFKAALQVRFSVNNGPEHMSNTINFTSRSLAIRSQCPAQKGDHVSVRFGDLPAIEGDVARVFSEGFAVVLDEASLSRMEQSAQSENSAPFSSVDLIQNQTDNHISSPFMRARASLPVRARITTTGGYGPNANRHFLSIVTADPDALRNLTKVWVSASEARWSARTLRFQRQGKHGFAVLALNEWQLHMAACYGLSITIIGNDNSALTIGIDAEPMAEHLNSLAPPAYAVSA